MYTQCPACHTAFRVTARVLQQAGGRVRCGGCSSAFNALEYLSEELPVARATAPAPDPALQREDARKKKLLETLDKLAGPENVVIEDTGVEWQVLDETAASQADGGQDSSDTASMRWTIENEEDVEADAEALPEIVSKVRPGGPGEERRETADGVMRFDDNTPLPEDYDDVVTVTPPVPRRREQDKVQIEKAHFDEKQFDLALGSPDEWVNLLDEVDAAEATGKALSIEVEEELAAIHNELTARPAAKGPIATAKYSSEDDGDAEPVVETGPVIETETPKPGAPAALALQDTGDFEKEIEIARAALLGEEPDAAGTGGLPAGEVALSLMDEPAPGDDLGHGDAANDDALTGLGLQAEVDSAAQPDEKDQERTHKRHDGKSKRAAEKKEAEAPAEPKYPEHLFDENADNVETIIMEGEFVHGSLREQELAAREATAKLEEAAFLADTYSINRNKVRGGKRRADPAGPGIKVAVVVLGLLLAVQLMHDMRQTLSTVGAFNQTIAPVYRLLGQPITPQWNVKGWQFDTTSNAIDESGRLLTICSTVTNRSAQALPYPLVHVSVTDRWEEILGSEMLEPKDYLAEVPDFCGSVTNDNPDPSRPVAAGERFTAVMRVVLPSTEATGFKLNVCYRVDGQRARCATEDFRE